MPCSTFYLLFPFLRRVIKAKNSCHSPSFLYCQPRIHFEQAKKQVNSDRVTVKVHYAPCEGGKQAVCCIVSAPTNCEGEAGSLQLLGLDTSLLLLLIQALSCVPPALLLASIHRGNLSNTLPSIEPITMHGIPVIEFERIGWWWSMEE